MKKHKYHSHIYMLLLIYINIFIFKKIIFNYSNQYFIIIYSIQSLYYL
jgi:hypothetical protein